MSVPRVSVARLTRVQRSRARMTTDLCDVGSVKEQHADVIQQRHTCLAGTIACLLILCNQRIREEVMYPEAEDFGAITLATILV